MWFVCPAKYFTNKVHPNEKCNLLPNNAHWQHCCNDCRTRVNTLVNCDPPGGGRNKQISENEEEIRVFYCLELKNEEEIRRRWGKKSGILAKIFTPV